jgi:hypothetical protein
LAPATLKVKGWPAIMGDGERVTVKTGLAEIIMPHAWPAFVDVMPLAVTPV